MIELCRLAYERNGIPWDAALESLPPDRLASLADYWNEKIRSEPDRECVRALRRMSLFGFTCGGGVQKGVYVEQENGQIIPAEECE